MQGRRADAAAALVLAALLMVAAWDLLYPHLAVGLDSVTQVYPWYGFLGERLRAGQLPAWNPYYLSGAPFAADPLSGWTYVPAMLLFALLPMDAAARAYIAFHLLLAGVSTYALGRVLGMGAHGSLLAGVAYGLSNIVYVRNFCCIAQGSYAAWLPPLILCMELAIRSTSGRRRVLWWAGAGLGLSQVIAAWPGQGAYYALLLLGGYVAYRTVVAPPRDARGGRMRLLALGKHGGAVLLIGLGLSAAGLLPRLEYNALSSLAGGYAGKQGADVGGWSPGRQWTHALTRGEWYFNGAVLALAGVSPLLARARFSTPFFAAVSIGALVLSGRGPTPLHSLLYLLPGFQSLHTHVPQRIVMLCYLGAALLAGASLSSLPGKGARGAATLLLAPILAVPLLTPLGLVLPVASLIGLAVPLSLAAVYVVAGRWRGLVFALLLLAVFADIALAGRSLVFAWMGAPGKDGMRRIDLGAYYEAGGALHFLRARREAEGPSRYVGYGPDADGEITPYTLRFAEPAVTALGVNNRAIPLQLEDVQGYNAVHLARYDEYVAAMNGGREQNYHDALVLPEGRDSPLLDLLNARYMVTPTAAPLGTGRRPGDAPRTVYEDDQVRVLERGTAMPRAWLVHSARRVARGEALQLLSSGEVDPRETALLEVEPPPLARPRDAALDEARVIRHEPERMVVGSNTTAAALLVLSEMHYPGWKAYVDGRPAPVYLADHLLRAVLVPAGRNLVELRYESVTMRIGMLITGATVLLVALAALAAPRRHRVGCP